MEMRSAEKRMIRLVMPLAMCLASTFSRIGSAQDAVADNEFLSCADHVYEIPDKHVYTSTEDPPCQVLSKKVVDSVRTMVGARIAAYAPDVFEDRTVRTHDIERGTWEKKCAKPVIPWHLAPIGAPTGAAGNSITVALLDGGLTLKGKLFKHRLWSDPADRRIHGANCGEEQQCRSLALLPVDAHGDAMAAAIAGQAFCGTRGVAANAKLMIINVFRKDGWRPVGVVKGLEWAKRNGAQIANLSLDGVFVDRDPRDKYGVTRDERAAILATASWFAAQGGIAIFASGNLDGPEIDATHFSAHQGVYAVAAHTQQNTLQSTSGWGATVSLAAPGEAILIGDPTGTGVVVDQGSSPAAALVTGLVAALLGEVSTSGAATWTSPRAAMEELLRRAFQDPLLEHRTDHGRRLTLALQLAPPPQWVRCGDMPNDDRCGNQPTFLALDAPCGPAATVDRPLPANALAIRVKSELRQGEPAKPALCGVFSAAEPVAVTMGPGNGPSDYQGPFLLPTGAKTLRLDNAFMAPGSRECIFFCEVLVPLP